jgi:hypothetical protein
MKLLNLLSLAGLAAACAHEHDDKQWTREELDELEAKWGYEWPFAGINTFAHLKHVKCLTEPTEPFDIAIVGVPFDTAELPPRSSLWTSSNPLSVCPSNIDARLQPSSWYQPVPELGQGC